MERERKMEKYRRELPRDSPAAPATCAAGEPRAPVGRPSPTGTEKVTIILVIITVKKSRKRLRPLGRPERVKDEPRRRSSAGAGAVPRDRLGAGEHPEPPCLSGEEGSFLRTRPRGRKEPCSRG